MIENETTTGFGIAFLKCFQVNAWFWRRGPRDLAPGAPGARRQNQLLGIETRKHFRKAIPNLVVVSFSII